MIRQNLKVRNAGQLTRMQKLSCWWACRLVSPPGEGGKSSAWVFIILLVTLYYSLSLIGIALGRQNWAPTFLAVWSANILFAVGGLFLLWQLASGSQGRINGAYTTVDLRHDFHQRIPVHRGTRLNPHSGTGKQKERYGLGQAAAVLAQKPLKLLTYKCHLLEPSAEMRAIVSSQTQLERLLCAAGRGWLAMAARVVTAAPYGC
jgi:hypothetical protein